MYYQSAPVNPTEILCNLRLTWHQNENPEILFIYTNRACEKKLPAVRARPKRGKSCCHREPAALQMHDARRKKLQYYCWPCMGIHISILGAGPCLNFLGNVGRIASSCVGVADLAVGVTEYTRAWPNERTLPGRPEAPKPGRNTAVQSACPQATPPPHQVYRLQKCSKINYRYIAWSGYSSLQVDWQ